MKFTCPMCEAGGNLSKNDLAHPVTRTTCQNCGTILMINPDTGTVDAHKSPLKDFSALEISRNRTTDEIEPVLGMRPQGRPARDWTAVVVVAIIVVALIVAGIYFAFNLDMI